MDEAETRLRELTRRLVSEYLRPLLGLLADEGVAIGPQRERADNLVRALLEARVADDLRIEGRRRVVEIDDAPSPPALTFNGTFVQGVEEAEALGLLEQPVSEILGLSALRVALIFQLDDEEGRRTVLNRVGRDGGAIAGPADIPAVVEMRIRRFVERLEHTAEVYGVHVDHELEVDAAVETIVEADAATWPSWSEVAKEPFSREILEHLGASFPEVAERPDGRLVAEICWESLDLSPQSALRRAGELLRGNREEGDALGRHLRRLGLVFTEGGTPAERAAEWPDFEEVAEAWATLFRTEQEMLSWSSVRRSTPEVSVFDAPGGIFHLDEPESLPWSTPLLCWSIRERRALCDLLDGHRKSMRSALTEREARDPSVSSDTNDSGWIESDAAPNFVLRSGAGPLERDGDAVRRLERAVEASRADMGRRFDALDRREKKRALGKLRDAYDRCFDESSAVWERRFQSWRSLEAERAFALLAFETQRVLGAHVLFDPFRRSRGGTAGEGSLADRPTLVFVAAFPEGEPGATFGLPLAALRGASDEVSLRLRGVEVPADASEACRWLADEALPPGAVAELPTGELLGAVTSDTIALRVERSM